MTPEQALLRLKEGNARFMAGRSLRPNSDAARRKEAAAGGQHPFAAVIACSDSRVPVELLFDQGIGDIFVVRVAGNVCGMDETASIEYAIGHLSTPLFVVLGHSQCGAVTAVLEDEKLHGSIPELVKNIRPAVEMARREYPGLSGAALIEAAVRANARQSIADALKRSASIRGRADSGRLKIAGAVYDIATGGIEWLDRGHLSR